MEKAKQLLLHPKMKLADIAQRIGYQDVRHFTQVFRKKVDVTPTEYRQKNADAVNCNGLNLFGASFGDYPHDLILSFFQIHDALDSE